jgi:hypothetical protein
MSPRVFPRQSIPTLRYASDLDGKKVPILLDLDHATAYRPRIAPPIPWSFPLHEDGKRPYIPLYDRSDCPVNWPFESGTLNRRIGHDGIVFELAPVRSASPSYWKVDGEPRKFWVAITNVYHAETPERSPRLIWVAELMDLWTIHNLNEHRWRQVSDETWISDDVGVKTLVIMTETEAATWMDVNRYRMPETSNPTPPLDDFAGIRTDRLLAIAEQGSLDRRPIPERLADYMTVNREASFEELADKIWEYPGTTDGPIKTAIWSANKILQPRHGTRISYRKSRAILETVRSKNESKID